MRWMKMQWLWIDLVLVLGAVTAYALVTEGIGGLFHHLAQPGPWGLQVVTDLVVALVIGLVWMWRDARTRGISPVPYVVLTLATGSFGLLVYLLRYWQAASDERTRGGAETGAISTA